MKRKKKKMFVKRLTQAEKISKERKVSPPPQKAMKDKKKYDRKKKD